MRRLKRNQMSISYSSLTGMTDAVDAQGYLTGHHDETYATAQTINACVVFRGTSAYKPYGIDEQWSVQIIPNNPIAGIKTGDKFTVDGKDYFVLAHPTTMNEQRIFCE